MPVDGRGAQAPLPTMYAWTLTSCSCGVRTGVVGSHRLTRLDSSTAALPAHLAHGDMLGPCP